MANMSSFTEISNALKKAPHLRTATEVSQICGFVADISFFKAQESDNVRSELCRLMTYDYYSAGRTIFEKGEQGDTLYVILKGEVEVIDSAAQKPSELSDDETED